VHYARTGVTALLPFAQLDYPGAPAIAQGRYLARPSGEPDAEPDVLVIRRLGAVRAGKRLRKGRPVPLATEPEPEPLAITRLTLIRALPFSDEAAAADWLERVLDDGEIAAALLAETTAMVNRALLAYRVAAPDPYATDLDAGTALAVRFGYGTGEEVADGRWTSAAELPEGRRSSLRSEVIDGVGAQERIAAVLGGRDVIGPEESLLVDAERAQAEGRPALAALTVALAVETLTRSGKQGPGEYHGEATAATAPLRKRALEGAEIDAGELRTALRAARRAIRAARRAP
jgi:hypothetical protein